MDTLELGDIFPGLDDEALSSLDFENTWTTDIFDNLTEKDLEDALLTDVTSKSATKSEPIDVDIFGLGNDLVVGDEVEVKNANDHFISSSDRSSKCDQFPAQDDSTQTVSTDTSPETIRLTPERESNCSTPSNSDSFTASPHQPSGFKKQPFKRSKFEDMVFDDVDSSQKRPRAFSPPIVPCEPNPNAINRVHHVLQKGQTLILQTEKPTHRISHTATSQSRVKPLHTHLSSTHSVYRTDTSEFIRIKPLVTHQRPSAIYSLTSPGSHTSSDTDGGGDSPPDGIESRGKFSIFTARHGASVTTSTIRLAPATGCVYGSTGRYNSSTSYVTRQNDDVGFGIEFTGNYSGPYGSGNASTAFRQQPIFQNSTGILVLTEEEKRTLLAEGYSIPTRLPLSKQEERNLKKIRRKIKNKISAQESRRKKKEYVESLEKRVETYAQENADLKRRLDGLEGTNRSLLSQLRHLQQAVNKSSSTPTPATSTSSSFSSSSTSSASTSASASSTNSKKSSSTSTAAATTSSAYVMVFLACFLSLFPGQPDTSTPSASSSLHNSRLPSFSTSSPVLTTSRHIVGDLSTLGSLNQIGYTWTTRTRKMAPRVDGDEARGPNVSELQETAAGTASIYRMHEWARTTAYTKAEQSSQRHEGANIKSQASRSRLLGSAKDFEECEPMTWWEYFFGQSRAECHDDKTLDGLGGDHLTEPVESVNHTLIVNSKVESRFAIPLVEPNYVLGLANRILLSA